VGVTWYNVRSYLVKIYHVTQIKFNRLIKTFNLIETFLRVLPTKWRRKPAGIDMELNYATVTLCITAVHHRSIALPEPLK